MSSQDINRYSSVRILNLSEANEPILLSLGLPLDCGIQKAALNPPSRFPYHVPLNLSAYNLNVMKQSELEMDILVPDVMTQAERVRNHLSLMRLRQLLQMKIDSLILEDIIHHDR